MPLSREQVRELFESAMTELSNSEHLQPFPLGHVTFNDKFHHYMDADTDNAWIGFVAGVRMMERLERQLKFNG